MEKTLIIPENIALNGMRSAYSAIRHTQFLVKGLDRREKQIESLTAMADDYYDFIQGHCRMMARWKARRLMRMIEDARDEENLSVPSLETRRKQFTANLGNLTG